MFHTLFKELRDRSTLEEKGIYKERDYHMTIASSSILNCYFFFNLDLQVHYVQN